MAEPIVDAERIELYRPTNEDLVILLLGVLLLFGIAAVWILLLA